MSDLEVFAALVAFLATLGYVGAGRGVIKGRWSWSLEIVPPGKRPEEPQKPAQAPEEGAAKDAPGAEVADR